VAEVGIAARASRVGKTLAAVGKVLGCLALGGWFAFELINPHSLVVSPWFAGLVDFVARHAGGMSRETVAVVIWRLFAAVMVVGAVGVVKETLEGWEYGWKSLAWALAAAAAVIGIAVLVIVNLPLYGAPHGAAPAGKFYYPATIAACGWLLLVMVFAFVASWGGGSGGAVLPMTGRQMPNGSENAHRLAIGLALLAVVALALWRSHKDLANVGSSLPQFFAALPSHWDVLPWPVVIGLVVLALMAVMGLFRVATGRRGPFPKIGLRGAGWDIFWLVVAAGLWLWGAFLPRDFGWFDALDMPGGLYAANFALLALYLFMVVESGVTIALVIGGPGGAGPEPVRVDIEQQKFRW
jgi:hypothetical protein